MGRRTKIVKYEKGVSQCFRCYLRAASSPLPSVLLVTDSNGRNIVNPQVVSCKSKYFGLNAISLPGGAIQDGIEELQYGAGFERADFVVLALGTNDLAKRRHDHDHEIGPKCQMLIDICQQRYPHSEIVLAGVLQQKGFHKHCVYEANRVLGNIALAYDLSFLDFNIGNDLEYWADNDNLHLSDVGLRLYMDSLEAHIEALLAISRCADLPPTPWTVPSIQKKNKRRMISCFGIVSNCFMPKRGSEKKKTSTSMQKAVDVTGPAKKSPSTSMQKAVDDVTGPAKKSPSTSMQKAVDDVTAPAKSPNQVCSNEHTAGIEDQQPRGNVRIVDHNCYSKIILGLLSLFTAFIICMRICKHVFACLILFAVSYIIFLHYLVCSSGVVCVLTCLWRFVVRLVDLFCGHCDHFHCKQKRLIYKSVHQMGLHGFRPALRLPGRVVKTGGARYATSHDMVTSVAQYLGSHNLGHFDVESGRKFLVNSSFWHGKHMAKRTKLLLQFCKTNHKKIGSVTQKFSARKMDNDVTFAPFSSTFITNLAKCLQSYPNTSHLPYVFVKSMDLYWKKHNIKKNCLQINRLWITNSKFRRMVQIEFNKLHNISDSRSFEESSSLPLHTTSDSVSLYCVCDTPYDGRLMVECETCGQWFHPACVFDPTSVAVSLSREEWGKSHLVCPGAKVSDNSYFEHACENRRSSSVCVDALLASASDDDRSTVVYGNRSVNDTFIENSHCKLDTEILPSKQSSNSDDDRATILYNLPLDTMCESKPKQNVSTPISGNTLKVPPLQYSSSDGELSDNIDEDVCKISDVLSPENNSLRDCNSHVIKDASTGCFEGNVVLDASGINLETRMKFKHSATVDYNGVFVISLEDWQKMIKNRSSLHFGNNFYVDIMIKNIRKIYSGCVPTVLNNYLKNVESVRTITKKDDFYDEGWVNLYCSHKPCKKCQCQVVYKVLFRSFVDKVEGHVKISGQRNHCPGCSKSRRIAGNLRKKLQRELQNQTAIKKFRSIYDQLSPEERWLGAHTYLPSQSVLNNIKSESAKISKLWFINLNELRLEIVNKGDRFIRSINIHPPQVMLYSDSQIRVFNHICGVDVVYFDATGSVVRRIGQYGNFQVYTLLVRNPKKGGTPLPVATFLTTQHDANTISHFLENFMFHCLKLCSVAKKPSLVIIDGSMAMWNAVLKAFCKETRIDYYNRCYRVVTGIPNSDDLQKTVLHNCYSHAMKAAKVLCNKFSKNKKIMQTYLYWINIMFTCESLAILDQVMTSFITLTNCEASSSIVESHFNEIKHKFGQAETDHDNIDENAISETDFFFSAKTTDKLQEKNSPFYLRYKQKLDNFLLSNVCKQHKNPVAPKNVYFNPQFCLKVLEVIVSRISSTSQLMLGDLSRHAIEGTTTKAQTEMYQHYKIHCEALSNANHQTFLFNNKTQGVIEEHFRDLKTNILDGKRVSQIDDFVCKYYKSVKVLVKVFCDTFMHLKNICRGNAPSLKELNYLHETPVVESKFKQRKRKSNSYYSSCTAAKQIKYQNDVNAKCAINMMPSQFSAPYIFCPIAEIVEKLCKPICNVVWHKTPINTKSILNPALVMHCNQSLSWLDLCSLCAHPYGKTYIALTANSSKSHTHSTLGWLTDKIVDAYIARNVRLGNEMFPGKFGCLATILTGEVLRGRFFRNLDKAFAGMFRQDKCVCENVFIPVLYDSHFVVMWLSKGNKTLVLYDSYGHVSWKLLELIQQNLIPILQKFCGCEVSFKCDLVVKQLDQSSCGLCSCYAVDVVMSKIINIKVAPFNSLHYRMWLVYCLVSESVSCDIKIFNSGLKHLQPKASGLPNVYNNCWLNSILQGVQSLLVDTASIAANGLGLQDKLSDVIYNLAFGKVDEVSYLQLVKDCCSYHGWTLGDQQDPSEFMHVTDFCTVFNNLNINAAFEIVTTTTCETCSNVKQTCLGQHILGLPMFENVSSGSTLSEYCRTEFKGSRTAFCSICKKDSQECVNLRFGSMSKSLCIVLHRNIGDRKSTKHVIPDKVLTFKTVSHEFTLDLVSVVVHVGTGVNCGHYIAYKLSKEGLVTEFNDNLVKRVSWEVVKERIFSGGCVYFYKVVNSTPRCQGNVIVQPMKIVKRKRRRRCNLDAVVTSEKLIVKTIDLKYFRNGKLCVYENISCLDNAISVIYTKIIEELSQVLQKSFDLAIRAPECYRTCLLYDRRKSQLIKLNASFSLQKTRVSTTDFDNLVCFLEHTFCQIQVKQRCVDDQVLSQFFICKKIKSEFVAEGSVLEKLIGSKIFDASFYMSNVLCMEAITYFVMLTENLDYTKASNSIGITPEIYKK